MLSSLHRLMRACEPTTRQSLRFSPHGPPSSASISTSRPPLPTSKLLLGRRRNQKSRRQLQTTSSLSAGQYLPRRYGPAASPKLPPPLSSPRPEVSSEETGKRPTEIEPGDRQLQIEGTVDPSAPDSVAAQYGAGSAGDSAERELSMGLSAEKLAAQAQSHNTCTEEGRQALQKMLEDADDEAGAMARQSAAVHLSPPPYVHHFDTYTLVKDLERGGFEEAHSRSLMKGIRGLLADNLDLARKGLVSKSEFENEMYLFRTACDELRSAISTSRGGESQAQRTRRGQLSHELDILSQRMTGEFAALKDDLKEMFNDQKISTREMQRSIDTAIQELNYQITVSLNSDGKSTVESLRWVLTRRAATAIATSASSFPFSFSQLCRLNLYVFYIVSTAS